MIQFSSFLLPKKILLAIKPTTMGEDCSQRDLAHLSSNLFTYLADVKTSEPDDESFLISSTLKSSVSTRSKLNPNSGAIASS